MIMKNHIRLLNNFVRRRVLLITCAKVAPHRIPLSGERAKNRDYYSVYYNFLNKNRGFIVDSITTNLVVGRILKDEDGPHEEIKIDLQELNNCEIKIFKYLGIHEFQEKSEWVFYLKQKLGVYWVPIFCYSVDSWWFRRKSLVLENRMEILKYLIDNTLENSNYRFSVWLLLTDFYSIKVSQHPQYKSLSTKLQFILADFEEGKLISNEGANGYRLLPSALSELERHESDQNRIKSERWLQSVLLFVSFCSAIAAGIQAWVAFAGPG